MLTRKYYITPTLIIVVLNEGEHLLAGSPGAIGPDGGNGDDIFIDDDYDPFAGAQGAKSSSQFINETSEFFDEEFQR